jgi:hypothetical protein
MEIGLHVPLIVQQCHASDFTQGKVALITAYTSQGSTEVSNAQPSE